ncbi:MAG: DUF1501 domain-containing protein [Rhodospirillales bacterium]|nr:DUF1501 domain-containing protein [Rhodospirillales bacterium]
MVTQKTFSRRSFLLGTQGLLLGTALTPAAVWAEAPGDRRLVILVLRGGLDGLDMLRPYDDPNWKAMRPSLSQDADKQPLELTPGFALHPGMRDLYPLWRSEELAFALAVATPYRDKRSHFEGQDILEMGTATVTEVQDGWLNRTLALLPGGRPEGYAVAVAREQMLLLRGDKPALFWSPENNLRGDGSSLLDALYAEEPLFTKALGAAREADDIADEVRKNLKSNKVTPETSAKLVAEMLQGEARIAAFSMGGWDTHSGQGAGLNRGLKELANVLLTLRRALGPDLWGKTFVITMTEFGRTAAENGTGGTDHGTGATTILAGGGFHGGRLYGSWPGLTEGDLYRGRDLMPTQDIRLYPAFALRAQFGLDDSDLTGTVFPGLDMSRDPKFL